MSCDDFAKNNFLNKIIKHQNYFFIFSKSFLNLLIILSNEPQIDWIYINFFHVISLTFSLFIYSRWIVSHIHLSYNKSIVTVIKDMVEDLK